MEYLVKAARRLTRMGNFSCFIPVVGSEIARVMSVLAFSVTS